jgi:hypothetical protein
MKDLYPDQKEITDPVALRRAIDNACCLEDMNTLRMSVVKSSDKMTLLKVWQDKYLSLKRCPTCGRNREQTHE